MKKIMLCVVVLFITAATFAQTKVGTIDPEFIISKMPELAQSQEALKVYNQDLEKQLTDKIATYEAALKAANETFTTLSDEAKNAKQTELTGMENDIQKFRANGAQLIQLKQSELLNPLYNKISEALSVVAKEQSFTQVLTIGNNNNLAYADPAFDLTNAVMAKLGIATE
ncbi:OmpH family outer membrane protein [Dokdonia sinensis]|nr:OmpH family outer membrane protein [Dokdonia sinensis]